MFLEDVTNIAAPISSGWLDYAKTLLVLGGVSVLAIVAARFWLPRLRRTSTSRSNDIQVLAQCSFEPKRSLYVVRAGKQVVLLGSSESGIHFMTTLDLSDFSEGGVPQALDTADRNAFANLVRLFRSGKPGIIP
jgi:flagellar biogenesis protein FliO